MLLKATCSLPIDVRDRSGQVLLDLPINERCAPVCKCEVVTTPTDQSLPIHFITTVGVNANVRRFARLFKVVCADVARGNRLNERPAGRAIIHGRINAKGP